MSEVFTQSKMDFKPEYDSKEELMFSYYVSELLDGGWLKSAIYQPDSFILSNEQRVEVFVEKKNHNVIKEIKLLNKHSYTADWRLTWNRDADGLFCWRDGGVYKQGVFPYTKTKPNAFVPFRTSFIDGELVSYIDVKGEVVSRNNSSGITFPINQKWIYNHLDLFIQKIVVSLTPKGLFSRTFTPEQIIIQEVYKRDCKFGKQGDSKLKYEPILLKQWMKLHL